jgi:hypothetical protein
MLPSRPASRINRFHVRRYGSTPPTSATGTVGLMFVLIPRTLFGLSAGHRRHAKPALHIAHITGRIATRLVRAHPTAPRLAPVGHMGGNPAWPFLPVGPEHAPVPPGEVARHCGGDCAAAVRRCTWAHAGADVAAESHRLASLAIFLSGHLQEFAG